MKKQMSGEITSPNCDDVTKDCRRYISNSGDTSSIVIDHNDKASIFKFTTDSISQRLSKILEQNKVLCKDWKNYSIEKIKVIDLIKNYFEKVCEVVSLVENMLVLKNEYGFYIVYLQARLDFHTANFGCDFYSDSIENIEIIKKIIEDTLQPLMSSPNKFININWYYKTREGLESIYISDELSESFMSEAYPYLDVNNLAYSYNESNQPILVLMGPPGTGKTRLIRYILDIICRKKGENVDVIFASDQEVIQTGELFLRFLRTDTNFMVLEDIDYHLKARKDGNTAMYNFLSISNGIAVNMQKNKKIILSTNLPNVKNIDDALLRPGRCFGVIDTRELYYDEASTLLKKLGSETDLEPKKSYSLAELYNLENKKPKNKQSCTGFV